MRSEWTGPPVAIVGGGFSGVMTAAHLTRRGIRCLLIEERDRLGRGLAYPWSAEAATAIRQAAESGANVLLLGTGDRGEVRLDAHRLGLVVDEGARLGERFWAVGPLTRGMYWEIVAVPDIRVQVAQVADDIARELGAG